MKNDKIWADCIKHWDTYVKEKIMLSKNGDAEGLAAAPCWVPASSCSSREEEDDGMEEDGNNADDWNLVSFDFDIEDSGDMRFE